MPYGIPEAVKQQIREKAVEEMGVHNKPMNAFAAWILELMGLYGYSLGLATANAERHQLALLKSKVLEMRKYQRAFFKKHLSVDKDAAMKLEKEVDAMLGWVDVVNDVQGKMF